MGNEIFPSSLTKMVLNEQGFPQSHSKRHRECFKFFDSFGGGRSSFSGGAFQKA